MGLLLISPSPSQYRKERGSMKSGIERVKRLTCEDCCFFEDGVCCATYRKHLAPHKNGCLGELDPSHFTYEGHEYRPGFMELKREKNGEIWVYYNHDEEHKYDSVRHRNAFNTNVGQGGR